jgi:nucleoside-diphosphate-sugar epimerase
MVEALRRAAEVEIPSGKVIVVGDREATTVRELCEMIARLTGSPRPKSVPYWLVRYAAAACEAAYRPTGRRPPLSSRSLAFFDSNTSFDTSHARELLGCEPNFDVATGLEETWSFIDDGMAADEFDVDHFWAGYRPHN